MKILSVFVALALSGCITTQKPAIESGLVERYSDPVIPAVNNIRSQWPLLLHDGEKFRMWHMRDHGDGTNDLVYRESADPLSWSGDGKVVFNLRGFITGLVALDGVFYMAYYDVANVGARVATSTDGIRWSVPGSPLIPEKTFLEGPHDILSPFFLPNGTLAVIAKAWTGGL
jgi:hypothetical protein